MSGYSIRAYGTMIDPVRAPAYADAIDEVVGAGDVVVELGSGTGFFTILACRAGAKHVYAIESDRASISLAKQLIKKEGFADRVTTIHDVSTNVDLPEQGSVLLSDMRGTMPHHGANWQSVHDARTRLVTSDAAVIALRDRMFVAPVYAPDTWTNHMRPWGDWDFGIDVAALVETMVHSWQKQCVEAEEVVLPARHWATLEYREEPKQDFHGQATWTAHRPVTVDAAQVWFESDLTENIQMRNSPGMPVPAYGRAYFPLRDAVELRRGDELTIGFRGSRTHDGYIWTWRASVRGTGRKDITMRQSEFLGETFNADMARKHASGYRPTLTPKGRTAREALGKMDGTGSTEEIADVVQSMSPKSYPSRDAALQFVRELAEKYAE